MGRSGISFPVCHHDHADCFARGHDLIDRSKCIALTDSDFGERDCPFYKSRKQFDEEALIYPYDTSKCRKD